MDVLINTLKLKKKQIMFEVGDLIDWDGNAYLVVGCTNNYSLVHINGSGLANGVFDTLPQLIEETNKQITQYNSEFKVYSKREYMLEIVGR